MRYHILYTLLALSLLSACHSASTEEGNGGDTTGIDTAYELEEIDTTTTQWNDNFDQMFTQLDSHRYIGFPYFMQSDKNHWDVSNGIYGAFLLAKATGHEENLDSLIEWRINKFYAASNQKMPKCQDYSQMVDLLKQFRTADNKDIDLDSEGQDHQLASIYGIYTSYYFQKMIANMPETKKMEKSLEIERLSWKHWQRSQKALLKALGEGNVSAYEVTELTGAQNSLKIKADLDLYYSLTKPNYVTADTLYEKMTDQFAFFDVYNVFIKDIKATGKMGFGKKIQALTAEQKAWQAYIFARRVLSGKLTDRQEAIFDNATRRMQKWHIIQLKNRLKGYGYCSDAFRNSLLSDSCTYPELYKYVPMKLDTQF